MPTIAIVDGVALVIYLNDHLPPHLHAKFAGVEVKVSIASGEFLEGELPPAKARAVRSWLAENREKASFLWCEVRAGRSIKRFL